MLLLACPGPPTIVEATVDCDDDAFFDETWTFECATEGAVLDVEVEFIIGGESVGLMGLNEGDVWTGEAFETTVGAGCAEEVEFLFRAEGEDEMDEVTIRP